MGLGRAGFEGYWLLEALILVGMIVKDEWVKGEMKQRMNK